MVTRIVKESESQYISPLQHFSNVKRQNPNDIEQKPNSDINKRHNFVTNKQHMEGSYPKLDLVNSNAFTKFGKILSIPSQEIERKCNSGLNLGP